MTQHSPSPLSSSDLDSLARTHLGRVLSRSAGPNHDFRPDQLEAVTSLLRPAARTLVVQRTGWGKSAVYFAATSALRSKGSGPTLIVSPLLSLMRDQVRQADLAGLSAHTLNSTNRDDWASISDLLAKGAIDLLLISPERLGADSFAADLERIISECSLVVIDEAHCISDWGFDFRPDYQRLATLIAARPDLSILATTATANTRVTEDVARQLGPATLVLRGPLSRQSLRLSVVPELDPVTAFAWIDAALDELDHSGIIYVPTTELAPRLTNYLNRPDRPVAAYSGRLDPTERSRVEDDLLDNRLKAVVATSALGMGYDKPDLGFVIHLGSPSSPVAYYQQIGRAGRALDAAEIILIPQPADDALWEYFASSSIPDPTHISALRRVLTESTQPLTSTELADQTAIRPTRLDALLKILLVKNTIARTTHESKAAYRWVDPNYSYDHAHWDSLYALRRGEARIMRSYAHQEGCLMRYLAHALDDPGASDCGVCSACTKTLPVNPSISSDALTRSLSYLRSNPVELPPRKLFPSGLAAPLHGKIPPVVAPGYALSGPDAIGFDDLTSALGSPDAPAPTRLIADFIKLARRVPVQPTCVVLLEDSTHPALARSLAQAIADDLGLALFTPFSNPVPRLDPGLTSKQIVYETARTMALSTSFSPPPGPAILVTLRYRTGWASHLASLMLSRRALTPIYPLALYREA